MQGTVLVHHGIKGQQWGDRNGPPYPLTKAAKRAVKRRYETESDSEKNSRIAKAVVSSTAKDAADIGKDIAKSKNAKNNSSLDSAKSATNIAKKSADLAVAGYSTYLDEKYKNTGAFSLRKMSNDDLRREAERLRNEKRYMDLDKNVSVKSIDKMSDDRLKNIVRRLNLEQSYADAANAMTQPQKTARDEQIMKALTTTATVAAIAASVVTVAVGISKLQKK